MNGVTRKEENNLNTSGDKFYNNLKLKYLTKLNINIEKEKFLVKSDPIPIENKNTYLKYHDEHDDNDSDSDDDDFSKYKDSYFFDFENFYYLKRKRILDFGETY